MDRYQKVEKPKPELPVNENEIRITSQGLVRNYISYAITLLQERGSKEIVLKAMGQAISKTVAIAEIIKRRITVHQDNDISSVIITDTFEPIEEGLQTVEQTRHVSMISITLSLKELNMNSPGYQAPSNVDQTKLQYNYQRQQPPRQAREVYNTGNGDGFVRGRGHGKGRGRGWNRGGYAYNRGDDYADNRDGYENNQGGGYQGNRGGRYEGNREGGYAGNRDGRYADNRGEYANNRRGGSYADNRVGYANNRRGGYVENRGGYADNRRGGYADNRDGYTENRGGSYANYQDNGGYSNWGRGGGRGGYSDRGGGYGRGSGRGGYGGQGRGRMDSRPRGGGNQVAAAE